MAVIESIDGLEATIQVDDRDLKEYTPPEDEDTHDKVTRYVVAEPGKDFLVKVQRSKRFRYGGPLWDIAVYVKIDGKHAKSMFIRKYVAPKYYLKFKGVDTQTTDGNWFIRPFRFSELLTSDETTPPTSAKEINQAKKLGEIKISMYRGTIGADSTRSNRYDFQGTEEVHEKALKGRAISRAADLGEAKEKIVAPKYSSFAKHDKKPFATFKFKYRSMADLKAEMIVPRSPTPELPLSQRADEDLTTEQMLERLREFRAAAAVKTEDQKRVKHERSEDASGGTDNDDDTPEIVDPPPKRRRNVETVDLTSD